MRQLRIVVRKAGGALPIVIAASVASLEACGQSGSDSDSGGLPTGGQGAGGSSGTGGQAGTAGQAGAAGQGGSIIVIGGSGGALPVAGSGGSSTECGNGFGDCTEVTVELPEPGTPAEPGQICAATATPVVSNRAALITLGERVGELGFTGRIALAEELDELVSGTPAIDVMEGSSAELRGMTFANFRAVDGGFTFEATLPAPLLVSLGSFERMTLRATLEVRCDETTALVHSSTDVYFCSDTGVIDWASSGDSCCVCRVIAEMAPSPIVPGEIADDLPLARALRLRIVELARISNTLILLAENDGGDGLEYEWLASVGTVERLAPDVVRWTLAEGQADPLIQAAVSSPSAAAVASFAYNERAA